MLTSDIDRERLIAQGFCGQAQPWCAGEQAVLGIALGGFVVAGGPKTVLVRAGTFRDCVEVRVRHKREFVTHREEGTVEAVLTITFAPAR